MSSLRGWYLRFSGLLGKERKDRELAEELDSHLQFHIEDNLRAGMSPAEARRDALIKLGGIEQTKEKYRDRRGLPFVESVLQDVGFGLRILRKNPGFTVVVVLTLALGIGVNTAMFSVIDAILLRPLPFRDPDGLVQLWETELAPGNYPFNGLDYLDWQAQNHTLAATSLYTPGRTYNVGTNGQSETASATETQANFFSVLGVKAQIGRTFASEEDQDGTNRVAILSYSYWQNELDGAVDSVGKTIELDGEAHTVIGIMPPGFSFPSETAEPTDIWVPMDMQPAKFGQRGNHSFLAIGRLNPDATATSALADLATIAAHLQQQYPQSNEGVGANVVPLKEQITKDSRPVLLMLLGAVTLVLLVACTNVANLMLVRASKRQREVSLRAALGASRRRLIRQFLTESILLSLLGAALGLLFAELPIRVFQSIESLRIPRLNPIRVDFAVFLFTIFVSVTIGVLFGLAPALQVSRSHLIEDMKLNAQAAAARSRGRRSLHDLLMIGEIAISLALLVGAGLLLRSLANMRKFDLGVRPQNVLTVQIVVPGTKYADSHVLNQFLGRLLTGLEKIPGVEKASIATRLPLEGISNSYITLDDGANPSLKSQLVETNLVSPDYFGVFGVPFISGRTFEPEEIERSRVASAEIVKMSLQNPTVRTIPAGLSNVTVINSKMSRLFWPNQNPLGKHFKWGGPDGQLVTVVGVVGDTKARGIREATPPEAYFPLSTALPRPGQYVPLAIAVRASLPPNNVLADIRSTVRALDSGLSVFRVRTMDAVISGATSDMDVQTTLLATFAGLGLLLVTVGIYGVTAYLVTFRTREMGIRMALGARQRDVLRLIVGKGTKLTVAGLAIGVVVALALARLTSSLLFGVKSTDAETYLEVASLLGSVALLACYIPARRATKVDPMVALRFE